MEKIEVTKETYFLLKEKVERVHVELSSLQENLRKHLLSGAKDEDVSLELVREQNLQTILRENKNRLKKCVVINKPKHNDIATVGSLVKIKHGGQIREFILDGLSEASGFCSLSSPLGQKIKGSRAGDKFNFNSQEIIIISIS